MLGAACCLPCSLCAPPECYEGVILLHLHLAVPCEAAHGLAPLPMPSATRAPLPHGTQALKEDQRIDGRRPFDYRRVRYQVCSLHGALQEALSNSTLLFC